MKIVSHLPPRHVDDFFAIALLKKKYPSAKIEFVHPQKVPGRYAENPKIILVDVGGMYEPERKNYDHHQDGSIPCSLTLVLRHEFPEIYKTGPVLKFIDLADRFGVKFASRTVDVPLSEELDKKRKIILLSDLEKHGKEIASSFIFCMEKSKDYNEFIELLYKELDQKGVLREAQKKMADEEKGFRQKLERAEILMANDVKVAVSFESFAPYHYKVFRELAVDLIIERNSFDPSHTSIIKNTSSPKARLFDLSKVFFLYPKVFIHEAGFIAVVEKSIEEVDIYWILFLLTSG